MKIQKNALFWLGLFWLGLVWFFIPEFEKPKVVQPRPVAIAPSELGSEEQATIQVFEQSAPSVVYITNTQLGRGMFSLNVLEIPQGTGTGFVWDDQGHIVTNYHVIHGADKIEVQLVDGHRYQAKIAGVAPDYDLAVLRLSHLKDQLKPLPIGTYKELKVGQKVLAIGNPFGLDHSLTTGVVSALGRTIQSLTGSQIHDLIQTDAAINPGNSGGPLLDSFGRVIGVSVAIYSPSGANAGIGFAVPIDTVNRIVPKLISKGKISKAGLGLSLLPENLKQRFGVSQGVPIYEVRPDTAAALAGLEGIHRDRMGQIVLGDIIIAIDGQKIQTAEEMIEKISKYEAGDLIELELIRQGHSMKVKTYLQEL